MSQSRQNTSVFYIAFVALMLLLALTVEAARHDLGRWNFAVSTLIAAIKAIVITLYFMQVRRSDANHKAGCLRRTVLVGHPVHTLAGRLLDP